MSWAESLMWIVIAFCGTVISGSMIAAIYWTSEHRSMRDYELKLKLGTQHPEHMVFKDDYGT